MTFLLTVRACVEPGSEEERTAGVIGHFLAPGSEHYLQVPVPRRDHAT